MQLLVIELAVVFSLIPLVLRPFGAAGMFIFIGIGIIAANVQVLKAASFAFYAAPIPLGTVAFSATYIATDVLTEYYGRAVAKKAVKEEKTIREVVLEEGYVERGELTEEQLDALDQEEAVRVRNAARA